MLGVGTVLGSGYLDPGIGGSGVPSLATEFLADAVRTASVADCIHPEHEPELYGPTALNAQSGNQTLTVGLDRSGTVTVFRWPRTSFYDQIKYRTRDREKPRMGAYPNVGAFLGLVVETPAGSETTWLRDWESDQAHPDHRSDAIRTRYRNDGFGLEVEVIDVVATHTDAFLRRVVVSRDDDSPVEGVAFVSFENFNLVASKTPHSPTQDWCEEGENRDVARYHPDADAVVHEKRDVDESTGVERRVAVAMGFAGETTAYQVGGDGFEPMAAIAGRTEPTLDAYLDASDGELAGNDEYAGQTTGALLTDLSFEDDSATETVAFAAGETPHAALEALDRARERRFGSVNREKRAWYRDLLSDAPMPDTDDEAVLELCWRALVTLVANYDPESGALVASIATQSPYALDWVRDGAFFNHALDRIGLHDWVEKRNRWYASLQRRADDARPDHAETPPGNWAMNYYGDGVPGGPIPYEIDETGYGVWTLWDHYRATGDREYLRAVYPAIERAADYLVECRDPDTELHWPAPEDDHPEPSQTVVGAAPVWLGLDSATNAADALGEGDDAGRWTDRREELGAAIDTHLWDPEEGGYCRRAGTFPRAVAALAWPAEFESPAHPRMSQHLQSCWNRVEPAFQEPERGALNWGLYETKALVAIAKANDPESIWMDRVREGLEWVATEHAMPDTRVLGETWLREGDDVVSAVSQPHAWEQILFYLTALEAYPPQE
jgi:hypothetical protein